jgi:hypothetical protein
MGCGGERDGLPEYDPVDRVYRLSYDPDDERELSTVVVSAVSRVTGVPIEELELNAVVHPGALDLLFSDRPNGAPRKGGVLTFPLAGCEVTVEGSGEVALSRSGGARNEGRRTGD